MSSTQDIPLEHFDLTARAYNALRRANVRTVTDLFALSVEDIAGIPSLGPKSLAQICRGLDEYANRLVPRLDEEPAFRSTAIGALGLSWNLERRLSSAGISTLGELGGRSSFQLAEILVPKMARAVLVRAAAYKMLRLTGPVSTDRRFPVGGDDSSAVAAATRQAGAEDDIRSDLDLSSLELSARANNALKRAGIHTLGTLMCMGSEDIRSIRNVGRKTLIEIENAIERYGHLVQFGQGAQEPKSSKSLSVDDLDLPMRVKTTLRKGHVVTIEDLAALSQERLLTQLDLPWKDVGVIEAVLGQRGLALATERAEYPMAGHELITLAKRKKIPLDRIPVERMALSSRANLLVHGAGVATIGQLCRASQVVLEAGFRDKLDAVEEIQAPLRNYLLWLGEQDSWDPEILQQGISPVYGIELAETSFDQILDEFLGCLNTDRQQRIIRLRYGLYGVERRTLEEVGELIGVTRERVRQIQRKAMRQLQRTSPTRLVGLLLELLREILVEGGGLATTHYLAETVGRTVDSVSVNTRNAVRFLCSIDSRFIGAHKDMWGLEGYPLHRVQDINRVMVDILKDKHGFAPKREILAEFRTTELYENLGEHVTYGFLDACLDSNPGIEISVDGQCALKTRATARLFSTVQALRSIGRPAHYSEIAREANELLPEHQRASIHAIHGLIGRLPDIFVRCGRGIFGLAEWGLHQDESVVDAAYRVLREAGEPLHVERIIDRVLDTWQVERGSVHAAIQSDERFYPVGKGAYWLADGIEQPKGREIIESVTFLGQVISRQHIMTALTYFDRRYPDTNDYDSWLEERAHKHALRHDGRLYPCKFILSLARGCDGTDFTRGERTNSVFRRLGFEVIDKPQQASAGG